MGTVTKSLTHLSSDLRRACRVLVGKALESGHRDYVAVVVAKYRFSSGPSNFFSRSAPCPFRQSALSVIKWATFLKGPSVRKPNAPVVARLSLLWVPALKWPNQFQI